MSEYSPPTRKVRMTKAQMRKYLRDLEAARKTAEALLDPEKEKQEKNSEISELEEKLDDEDIFLS